MKIFVLKLELNDDKDKRKALKTVSTLSGIDLISMNMKDKKLTIVGTVDPVNVVSKLRKFWKADIISVGAVKEPEKKEEPKKEEAKKEEPKKEGEAKKEEPKKEEGNKEEAKKEEPKKEGEAKKEEPKKEEEKKKEAEPVVGIMQMPPPHPHYRPYYQPMNNMPMPYRPYYPPPVHTYYYPPQSVEENPNGCVIS